ncbi:restriction endonuclease subunit S [Veillonella sp.]|uniref:restriction endonuclease subunit S n=1 Tax=Veillonella sp. TaxID=1926307 RepID=UPI0012E9C204|nr:restriction endonuclease subunit S [Veillonella sp.]
MLLYDRPIVISRSLAAIKPYIGLLEYLYFLSRLKNFLNANASGTIFKSITTGEIRKILVPVPPVLEQKRIVKHLIRCFRYIDILK